jgi:hypothetical protein
MKTMYNVKQTKSKEETIMRPNVNTKRVSDYSTFIYMYKYM